MCSATADSSKRLHVDICFTHELPLYTLYVTNLGVVQLTSSSD